jgi:hypothetical protein
MVVTEKQHSDYRAEGQYLKDCDLATFIFFLQHPQTDPQPLFTSSEIQDWVWENYPEANGGSFWADTTITSGLKSLTVRGYLEHSVRNGKHYWCLNSTIPATRMVIEWLRQSAEPIKGGNGTGK